MQVIGTASATSTRPPREFFDRWCDLATHPEWAPSMAAFALDGEFGVGATGTSRTAEGREARFRVTEVEDGRAYADTTEFEDAELTVRHVAEPEGEGSRLEITASVDGPEQEELAFELGDLSESLQRDLDALIALLEK